MKKRTFLQLSSAIATGAAMGPLASCSTGKDKAQMKPMQQLKNWAGNLSYSTSNIFEPRTTADILNFVRKCKKLRVLGTRHCFNRIADSDANLILTTHLKEIYSIDTSARTVTVGAGIRYGELCEFLDKRGFALPNLASLPHISIAGACATATHGSGIKNGNLATSISAFELITGKGEVVTLSREKDPESFYGAVVGLGALGVVTKVTLDLVPTFRIRQDVYLGLPLPQLETSFDEIMSKGYSVSLFTDWQTDRINQVWIKSVVDETNPFTAPADFFGATLADRNVHPIIELSAENCTEQMGIAGPWYDRLPHFRMGFTPSSGEELQAEYFIPRAKAAEAIKAVATLRDQINPYLMITEIRTIAADNLWLSPCYQQDSVAIHFTLKQDVDGVASLLPLIEEKLSPFSVRPHWGKWFSIPPLTLASRYERMPDFRKLMDHFDPEGKFRNAFVDENIMMKV